MSKNIQPVRKFDVSIDESTFKKLKEEIKEESQTTIHCNYVSKHKYINGGWLNIYATTYLSSTTTNNTDLELQHVENVPIAPNKHFFTKVGDHKRFTLYFPAIPKDWETFDLVEKTNTGNGFVIKNIHRNNNGIYEIFID